METEAAGDCGRGRLVEGGLLGRETVERQVGAH